MSDTRRTWDGLRVWKEVWYPKHPQLFVRAIPEKYMAVRDARPRPPDEYITNAYPRGTFCLESPNGVHWTFIVEDDGSLVPYQITVGTPAKRVYLGQYYLTVDDDGSLYVNGAAPGLPWHMWSVNGVHFTLTVDDSDLSLLVSVYGVPDYMEGVFTLTSPNGTNYIIYIVDDGAAKAVPGTWGPVSTHFFLDNYKIAISNDGALLASLSGEVHPPSLRMVSTGGYEYIWMINPDGAVKVYREGHWWDVPVLVYDKPVEPYDLAYAVTMGGRHVWVEEP